MRKTKRKIDLTFGNIGPWLKKTYRMVEKKEIKVWQGVSAIFFVLGLIMAGVAITKIGLQIKSKALGETAELKLVTDKTAVNLNEAFSADVILDTKGASAVAVKAVVSYDPQFFVLDSFDTGSTPFTSNNTCQYEQKSCQIISNDSSAGKIAITVAKPTPGVKTASGVIATLNFHGIKDFQPTADNLKIDFVSGSWDDSDVILDDGQGSDILASVVNARVSIGAPTCASFTYSPWAECQLDGTQTRTVISSSPTGCVGGDPVLQQACTPVEKSTCTRFKYSTWSACDMLTNKQSRTVTSSYPEGCVGGTPVLEKDCTKGSIKKSKQ